MYKDAEKEKGLKHGEIEKMVGRQEKNAVICTV